VILTTVYSIYSAYVRAGEPPALHSYAQIPVKVGEKVLLLGVEVVGWQLPAEAQRPQSESQSQPPDANASQQPEPKPAPGTSPAAPANANASAAPAQNANQRRN